MGTPPGPRIDLLLPYKETFSAEHAGAVSTVVHDLIACSPTPTGFRVVGRPVDRPLGDLPYLSVRPIRLWMHGRNLGLAASYLAIIKRSQPPDLVEVHNRCNIARYIAEKRGSDINVVLYLHNDPRDMGGARRPSERLWLANHLCGVFCVSNYIKSCFLDGLPTPARDYGNIRVISNGVDRRLRHPRVKENVILVVGRIVPEKGILECAKALARILPRFSDWNVQVVGGRYFEVRPPSAYEREVAVALGPLGAQAEMTGFLPPERVRELQIRAAIGVCPSIWNEPSGKVALETLAAGCALVTTRRGGIPEVAQGRALIVDDPSVETFAAAFEDLLSNPERISALQQRAWDDFPFTARAMAAKAVQYRQELLG